MAGNSESGRKPGFKHSESTRRQISNTLQGSKKTELHRERISHAKSRYNLDAACAKRYEALCAEYPTESDFFEENMLELLFAMQDTRTEKELSDIRYFYETASLRAEHPYEYSSTSCFAAEDAVIRLLDFKREMANRTLH